MPYLHGPLYGSAPAVATNVPPPPPPEARPTIAAGVTEFLIEVDEGNNASPETLTIANIGDVGSTLVYTITLSDPFLSSIDPDSGSVAQGAPTEEHELTFDLAALEPGEYSATITITDSNATNSPRVIPVQIVVHAIPEEIPEIELSETEFEHEFVAGNAPDPDVFTVRNSGAGTLNYSISDNAAWLSVSPSSGSSAGEADTVTITYDTYALPAGDYTATITVSDPAASNTPQTIAVSLTITAAPVASVLYVVDQDTHQGNSAVNFVAAWWLFDTDLAPAFDPFSSSLWQGLKINGMTPTDVIGYSANAADGVAPYIGYGGILLLYASPYSNGDPTTIELPANDIPFVGGLFLEPGDGPDVIAT